MGHEGESGQDPPELTQLLSQLAEVVRSPEEMQRIEPFFRIHGQMYDVRRAAAEAEVERTKERLAAMVTANAESLKLHFEAYKNLTVLDSGALVAFALVTHNLVPSPVQLSLLSVAYACVLVSLIASLAMMFVVGDRVYEMMSPGLSADKKRVWRIVIRVMDPLAIDAFVLGLVLFLLFLSVNL